MLVLDGADDFNIFDARDVAVGFYEKLDYELVDGVVFKSGPFDCLRMRKQLS